MDNIGAPRANGTRWCDLARGLPHQCLFGPWWPLACFFFSYCFSCKNINARKSLGQDRSYPIEVVSMPVQNVNYSIFLVGMEMNTRYFF
jgi:hypothetical protein